MKEMLTMRASTVRKEWSSVIDSVVREKPAFIKRTRDYMMLCTTDMVTELVSGVKYIAIKYIEDDGSITLSLESLDIMVNDADETSAIKMLVQNIIEYAEEYYQNFERYSHSSNRKSHIPYIIKALTAKTERELEDAVICQNGKI